MVVKTWHSRLRTEEKWEFEILSGVAFCEAISDFQDLRVCELTVGKNALLEVGSRNRLIVLGVASVKNKSGSWEFSPYSPIGEFIPKP